MKHELVPNRNRSLARILGVLTASLCLALPAAAQFGKNKIHYDNFDWRIYRSPHFDMYYYPEEEHLLQNVVSLAESAYDHLSRRFDYQIEERTPMIFYKTHAEFEQNNIILGFIPEGVGAFATDVRFRMVLPVDLPANELYQLILHELTHIFQYHILYGGKVSRGLRTPAPTWLIEGMASYYADDESTSDKMFLRDAVVNDLVPPITQAQGGGFFAYRFGHAVYDFMEDRWGQEGILDFLYEYRSSIGSQVGRAIDRAFRVEAEDFDADFRRWLREKYLPELVNTGEPSYFGRRFFSGRSNPQAQYFSPTVSPSGDLVAAIGNPEGTLDVVLFDTRNRRPMRNLTKGLSNEYQYLNAQFATSIRRQGRDLAFSPDGNLLAAFGKIEEGRRLFLIDVIKGGLSRVIKLDVQQPFAPTFSPDGRKIAFAGTYDGQFDIFELDLATEQVQNLTDDVQFDGGPMYSPNGDFIYYSSVVSHHEKIFRLPTDGSSGREVVLQGEWNDKDPWVSKDGQRLFFTSDRNSYDNIYSYDLESGEVVQHTNAITGCIQPALIERADGDEALIYAGYWKGRFDLYRGDLEQINEEPLEIVAGEGIFDADALFEPDIQVAIDPANDEDYTGFKLFLENATGGVGVTSDQRFISQALVTFSDYLGDRRLFMTFQSVSSFSDFDISYVNMSRRMQWGVRLYDERTFYLAFEQVGPDIFEIEEREQQFSITGLQAFLSYPINLSHRFEASAGYAYRDYNFQQFFRDPATGELVPIPVFKRTDDYPEIGVALVGDTTNFKNFGPHSGRRWRIGGYYSPDFDESGTLTSQLQLDWRQYIPVTKRSLFAVRTVGFSSWGNFPNIFAFGGLDTVRGFRTRSLVGDRGFYTNLEFRFPLVDALWFPFLRFNGIRGRVFLDVGGAWYDYAGEEFDFWDSDNDRLDDAVSSWGWGLTTRFLGVDMHWDFAQRWDFDESLAGFETSFWIGRRF